MIFFEIKLNVLSTVFDDDNSGTMDFSEFLMASNALKLRLNFSPLCVHLTISDRLSSESDQLNWIFNVYDKNCGGTIDPEV